MNSDQSGVDGKVPTRPLNDERVSLRGMRRHKKGEREEIRTVIGSDGLESENGNQLMGIGNRFRQDAGDSNLVNNLEVIHEEDEPDKEDELIQKKMSLDMRKGRVMLQNSPSSLSINSCAANKTS